MDWQLFLSTLSIAGQGWFGVFAVIAAVWVSVALMLRAFKPEQQ